MNYNDDAIQVLEGLDAVRKRPGMVTLAQQMEQGLHHLVWEIVDNAVDEALSGFGDVIAVTLNRDGSVSVSDSGRGMPTGMHAMGKPTVEVIFTVLHAGGRIWTGVVIRLLEVFTVWVPQLLMRCLVGLR